MEGTETKAAEPVANLQIAETKFKCTISQLFAGGSKGRPTLWQAELESTEGPVTGHLKLKTPEKAFEVGSEYVISFAEVQPEEATADAETVQ